MDIVEWNPGEIITGVHTESKENNEDLCSTDGDLFNKDDEFQQEEKLGYFVEDGKYWKHLVKFDQEKIDFLDELWSRVIELD